MPMPIYADMTRALRERADEVPGGGAGEVVGEGGVDGGGAPECRGRPVAQAPRARSAPPRIPPTRQNPPRPAELGAPTPHRPRVRLENITTRTEATLTVRHFSFDVLLCSLPSMISSLIEARGPAGLVRHGVHRRPPSRVVSSFARWRILSASPLALPSRSKSVRARELSICLAHIFNCVCERTRVCTCVCVCTCMCGLFGV